MKFEVFYFLKFKIFLFSTIMSCSVYLILQTYKPWMGNSPIAVKWWRIIFYPAALARTQYVSGDTVILLIGSSRLFQYRVALFPWIRIGLYIVGKIRFNSMKQVGHVLNDYFNQTNPQWRRPCKNIITTKNTCLTSGSTNIK